MFFVVTTGRSGSTTIARTLGQIDGCHSVHEPEPALILESTQQHCGDVAAGTIHAMLRETRFPTVNGKVYCESNQTLSLIIPDLVSVFPEARFIWLIRNGLDVVASTYQKQWYTGHSENHSRYEDCSAIEKAWIDGRVRADRIGEMSESEWEELNRFEKCCWYWGYVNRVIEKDLRRCAPDRFYTLRLEDMPQELPKLVKWMGFESSQLPMMRRDNIAKRVPFHWIEWSTEQHAAFARQCGDVMDKHYPSWRTFTGKEAQLYVAPAIAGLAQKVDELQKSLSQKQSELNSIKNNKLWRFVRFFFKSAVSNDKGKL